MQTQIKSTKTKQKKYALNVNLKAGVFFSAKLCKQNLEIPHKQMIEQAILDRLIVFFV